MRERLARLDRARAEFVANASHELRTPLFALGGFLELFGDEELDEATQREFVDSMREQVDRLTKLAAELLDLTRLDSGRLRVERAPVELGDLAESLAEEFAAIARSSDHPLSVEDGEATALGDEERVRQIGRILLENALVHTPPGTEVRGWDPGGARFAAVRALLPPRRDPRLRQRPRTRDRPRACRAHGRLG